VGVYGLAEINHYCKQNGQRFVHWLGETPDTLGVVLDGILDQCRRFFRRILFGERNSGSSNRSVGFYDLCGTANTMALLDAGGDASRKSSMKDSRYSLGITSSTVGASQRKEEASELQGLVDEFKGWLVAPQQGLTSYFGVTNSAQNEKRELMKRGFMLGVAIGIAFLRT